MSMVEIEINNVAIEPCSYSSAKIKFPMFAYILELSSYILLLSYIAIANVSYKSVSCYSPM